jgi:hypothetical protein
MNSAIRIGRQLMGIFGCAVLLCACGNGQQKFEGIAVDVCPVGFAMAGAHTSDTAFTCLRVVAKENDRQVHTQLDKGTEHNFGSGDVHVCPPGWYVRGFHNSKNWLVCSDGVVMEESFLDANPATQTQQIHMCPQKGGRSSIMTGLHAARNDLACASFR